MINNTQRGFTLFIAVLLGSLMLAIGFSIFNLAFKELILSASAKESQIAFYAADTGLECALYYDQSEAKFQTTGPGSFSINCAKQVRNVTRTSSAGVYTWQFWLNQTNDLCVWVEVKKFPNRPETVIRALGYNTCDTADPRRTERGLRVRYKGI